MKKRQKLPVRFWHGMNLKNILDELTPADKKQLNRLMAGDYTLLNLEKLKNSSIYSIRVDSGRRILFTTIEKSGKKIALILEILPTHDYLNAKSLKPQVIKQFLLNADIPQLVFDAVTEIEGVEKTELGEMIDEDLEIEFEFIEYDYVRGRGITLTDEQKNVQQFIESPAIIRGMGGSGKTAIINAIIVDRVEAQTYQEAELTLPIVYVSEKTTLVATQRDLWAQHPLADTPAGRNVLFLTTKEAIARFSSAERVHGYKKIASKELVKRIQAKVDSFSFGKLDTQNNIQKLMHEFEIMAACNTAKAYFKLGQHQSNYTMMSDRKLLWRAYDSLKTELTADKDKFYSPRLYREETAGHEKQCALTIIDEAQKGSRVAKFNLRLLSEEFFACVDSLQSLDKIISDVPYLIEHLGPSATVPANVHTLNQSFRNPDRVILLANAFNKMRRFVLGGTGDKTEQTQFESGLEAGSNAGIVQFIERKSVTAFCESVNTDRADFAIITTKENIESVKQQYNNPQAFTTSNIGGLEYDNIIIDGLLDQATLARLNALLSTYTAESKVSVNRPKEVSDYAETNGFFNTLNTALTRPRKRLYIVDETPTRKTAAFYNHLNTYIDAANTTFKSEDTSNAPQAGSTQAEWMARVNELVANSQWETAEEIWINKLGSSKSEFAKKYKQTSEGDTIIRLDYSAKVETLSTLKDALNKQSYKQIFLEHDRNKPSLLIRLLTTKEGQENIFELINFNFKRMLVLFTDLLEQNEKIESNKYSTQNIIVWLVINRYRAEILDGFAKKSAPFLKKVLTLIEPHLNGTVSLDMPDQTIFTMPVAGITGITSHFIFKKVYLAYTPLVQTLMQDCWFRQICSDTDHKYRPYLVYLANNAVNEKENLSYLDEITFPTQHFISHTGELNAELCDELIASPGGVRILNRCVYECASPVQAARLSSDLFIQQMIIPNAPHIKTRLDFLLTHSEECLDWVRNYFMNHPNRVAFFNEVIETTSDGIEITRVSEFFSQLHFMRTILLLSNQTPNFLRSVFTDVPFNFTMRNGEHIIKYLIGLQTANGTIRGLDIFKSLLDAFKSDLLPLENIGSLMEDLLKPRVVNEKSTVTHFGYFSVNAPELLITLVRYYPTLVRFITTENLTQRSYIDRTMTLVELLLTCAVNNNKYLLLRSLVQADDYHLLRHRPVSIWLTSPIARILCENPLGESILLKLVELSTIYTLAEFKKMHFDHVTALHADPKTRRVFNAIQAKLTTADQAKKLFNIRDEKVDTPLVTTLITNQTLESIEAMDALAVRKMLVIFDSDKSLLELTAVIKSDQTELTHKKILTFLRKIAFTDNREPEGQPPSSVFMDLSANAEGRRFILACFERYNNKWITFNETTIRYLFIAFRVASKSAIKLTESRVTTSLIYFIEDDIRIFNSICFHFPHYHEALREELLMMRDNFTVEKNYFNKLILLLQNNYVALGFLFTNIVLSDNEKTSLVAALSMKISHQTFHETSWNTLAYVCNHSFLRTLFISILTNNNDLINRFTVDAWSSPVDPYDNPSDNTNLASLVVFSRSRQGKEYFEENASICEQVYQLTKQPSAYTFMTNEECADIRHMTELAFYQPNDVPDKQICAYINVIATCYTESSVRSMLNHNQLIPILLYHSNTKNHVIQHNLLITLLSKTKISNILVDHLASVTHSLHSLFECIQFNATIVPSSGITTYQRYLCTNKTALKLIISFIEYFPGKLRTLKGFDSTFKGFKQSDFKEMFAHCSAVNLACLLREFPALEKVKLSKTEDPVSSNASTFFSLPTHAQNSSKPKNNNKRKSKK